MQRIEDAIERIEALLRRQAIEDADRRINESRARREIEDIMGHNSGLAL